MKPTPRLYAQALFRAVSEISDKERNKVLSAFFDLLTQSHREMWLTKIISEYERIVDESKGTVRAELSTAFEENQKQVLTLLEKLKMIDAEHLDMSLKTDPGLIGGFTLRAGDTLIDASIKKQLLKLKQTLTV